MDFSSYSSDPVYFILVTYSTATQIKVILKFFPIPDLKVKFSYSSVKTWDGIILSTETMSLLKTVVLPGCSRCNQQPADSQLT